MARVDVLAKRNGSGIVGGAPRSATCIPPCGAYAESRRCLKVVRLLSMCMCEMVRQGNRIMLVLHLLGIDD